MSELNAFEPIATDIAIVGYGPIGQLLALRLGQLGYRVEVVERWTERYPLPRAVCVDHEIYRVLSAMGMREGLEQVTHDAPVYRWFNADWKELLAIDWAAESISGGPQVNFVHQPTLEELLDQWVADQPTVSLNLGWQVVGLSQTRDWATLRAKNTDSGQEREIKARYIIGADGANSIVQKTIGGDVTDRGFQADWLVVDILPNDDAELDIPPAAQWCNPERPTTIVPAGVRNGRYYRRWEFMRLPHETVADIETEDKAWELLSPWVGPEQATLVRHKIYTFQSLLAREWRDRRLLLAGDAAHVMPPFMGQGMCTGFRDAWNLAWKLDLILRDRADDALLDSYAIERYPHASDVIDMSMYLGQLICQPDPEKAAERDRQFFEGNEPPMPEFPQLKEGLLSDTAGIDALAGQLSPHGTATCRGQDQWLDDCLGAGRFVLIARRSADIESLNDTSQHVIDALNIAAVALDGGSSDGRVFAVDSLSDKYQSFLDDHQVDALLVRPDFYIFGSAGEWQSIDGLLVRLRDAIPGFQAAQRLRAAEA